MRCIPRLPLCRWRAEVWGFLSSSTQSQADLYPFDHTEPLSGDQATITPAHMAQTSTHGLLLAESTSIEYVPRLSPPMPRNSSHSSTSSIDSTSNYSPQGGPTEGASPTTLPTFYPSGSRDASPSSDPDKSPRNWPDILFHGWRVVLLSCMPLLGSSFQDLTKLCFKGSMYFWCSYHYPCALLALSQLIASWTYIYHLVGDDTLHERHA